MDLYIEKPDYDNIINHCIRKLEGIFYGDETKEKQALGLEYIGKSCVSEYFWLYLYIIE